MSEANVEVNVEEKDFFNKTKYIKELTQEDFHDIATGYLKNNEGCVAVLFYVPWCPWCEKIKEEWVKFGKTNPGAVLAFNSEKHLSHVEKIKSELPGLIQSYPTFVYYNEGVPQEIHNEERTVSDFVNTYRRFCFKNEVKR